MLEVGYIGRAHGLGGEVTVRLTTNRLERVAPGAQLTTATGRELTVSRSRPHQKGHIVAFEGVTSRESADALRGETLMAEPLADDDTVWVHDLIGRRLVETDGTERGVVVAVEANPASDLLVTDGDALVPLTFMVDLDDDRIVIDPPAGLFER